MSHTKGRVTLFNKSRPDKSRVIAIMDEQGRELVSWMGFDTADRPKREILDNARRLVACWNEHNGLVHDNAQLYQSLQGEMNARIAVENECHELVKALRLWMHFFGGYHEDVIMTIAEDGSTLTEPQEVTARILAKYSEQS